MWEPMATILRKLVHRKVAAVHHRISTLQCMTLGYLLNVPCLCFAQDELQPRAIFPLVLWPRCPLNNSSYMSFWELERDQKHGINFMGRTGNWKVFFSLESRLFRISFLKGDFPRRDTAVVLQWCRTTLWEAGLSGVGGWLSEIRKQLYPQLSRARLVIGIFLL